MTISNIQFDDIHFLNDIKFGSVNFTHKIFIQK